MISVSNLTVSYSGEPVFEGLNFLISPGDRIGLTGKNGSGKSTLLKTLGGIIRPESGEVSFPKETRAGYLPQEMEAMKEGTLYDEVQKAFARVMDLRQKIEDGTEKLVKRSDFHTDDYLSLASKISEWNEELNMAGGNKMEARIEQVLKGLGFNESDFHNPVANFSGGWQMRIHLARLLLENPVLLLLDEPTNHLDIESVIWLEHFLKNYEGAVIIVSHDRRFLDELTNRTLELENGKLYDYKAAYSEYKELRRQRKENQLSAWKNQQKVIKQNERFIERFRYKAEKASQVQSRIKQMDKMEKVEPDEDDNSSIKFRFPDAPRSGKIVIEAKQLNKSYDDNVVLKNVDFSLERGDKVAFLGKNGAGKSTFARILAGNEPYEGVLKTGHNVIASYFSQHRTDELEGNNTVLETMEEVASAEQRPKLRGLLGAFLFQGDDVYKKTKVLSGGEKSRLSLARLLLKPCNLLILDEPTNHLDMTSKDVLKQALNNYDGTMVVVSHDREFLEGLVDVCYEFNNQNIHYYPGDIHYFLEKKGADWEREGIKPSAGQGKTQSGKSDWKARKSERNRINKIKNRISKTEKSINKLEKENEELEIHMQDPSKVHKKGDDGKSPFEQYEENNKKINALYEEWETLQAEWETVSQTGDK